MPNISQTIHLDDSLLIGKGRDRACYAHPYNPNLCIKVALKTEKQSKREVNYLNYLLHKGTDVSLLSTFKGRINTNFGWGYEFELIREEKNQIADTLSTVIKQDSISREEIISLIQKIQNYIEKESICIFDLSPNNIVVFKNQHSDWSFKIIDGIGFPKPNPFVTRSKHLTLKLMQTRIARLKRKINELNDFAIFPLSETELKQPQYFKKTILGVITAITSLALIELLVIDIL